MISKKTFLKIINLIIKEEDEQNAFDYALKEYAPSDFTGFAKMGLLDDLVDILKDLMEDEHDYIGWWLWDSPERGKKPEYCKIWLGDSDDPDTEVVVVDTPEKLYDFMVTEYSKTPSKDTLRMVVKAQDNGIKFSLKRIQELIDTNSKTKNEGWEERNTLLKLAKDRIEDEYRFTAGTNKDLSLDEDLHIISVLDEES